jgi:hypothetical protein
LNPPWQQTQATQSRQLSNQSIIAAYVNRITDSLNRSARFLTKYSSRTKRRQEGGGEVAIEFTRKIQTHSTEANKSAFNPTVSFVKAQRSATNGIRASRVSRSSFDRHRTTERPHRDRVGDTVRAYKFASGGEAVAAPLSPPLTCTHSTVHQRSNGIDEIQAEHLSQDIIFLESTSLRSRYINYNRKQHYHDHFLGSFYCEQNVL